MANELACTVGELLYDEPVTLVEGNSQNLLAQFYGSGVLDGTETIDIIHEMTCPVAEGDSLCNCHPVIKANGKILGVSA